MRRRHRSSDPSPCVGALCMTNPAEASAPPASEMEAAAGMKRRVAVVAASSLLIVLLLLSGEPPQVTRGFRKCVDMCYQDCREYGHYSRPWCKFMCEYYCPFGHCESEDVAALPPHQRSPAAMAPTGRRSRTTAS
ncbi:hypothetical protein BS78_04G026600 [Paspalum vaginatum]|nr:hypothetical protein BS78_04G026600 [Paspalum vaginatum]